jgi:hypothetical protein
MCADCFCTHSPSKTTTGRNMVVIDLGIEGLQVLRSNVAMKELASHLPC